jgi:hypothetical protein
LSWNEFKALVNNFVKRILGIEAAHFRVMDKSNKGEIRGEDDYRRAIEKILGEFSRCNFVFDVAILDIIEKQETIIPMTPPSLSIRKDQQDYRVDLPKLYSYRMPQVRDMSPFSSKKMGGSLAGNQTPTTQCQ